MTDTAVPALAGFSSIERDLADIELADLIDTQSAQQLLEDFFKLTGIPMSVIDLKGRVLVGVGWQAVCLNFHRAHPESCKHCLESDTQLSANIPFGEFRLYKCKNNMWDVATPIMIGGLHVGNIFSGQFFFADESIDYELFRAQAQRYGFDESAYLAALEAVPRLSRDTVETGMAFYMKFAQMFSRTSDSNIRLGRSLADRNNVISELQRAHRALRDSESFYRQTLESIPGMVFTTRPDGYCDYQSQQWVDYTGVPMAAHLGNGWNQLLHPEDRHRAYEAWQVAVARKSAYNLEYRVRRRDGVYEWFKVIGRPILDESGQVVRWFGVAANINELIQAEARLQDATTAAEEANRAKSEFLANMSHEIRTPMTVFLAAIEQLLHLDEDPERRELLGMAEQSANRLRNLIDDILDISRIEARKVEIHEGPFELRPLLEEVTGLFVIPARGKDLRIETCLTPDTPDVIVSDRDRLAQVLINLVGNAIKFTPAGEIRVSVRACDSFLEFTVADTGIGIPEDKCGLLFQNFSQVDSSFTRKFGGSGLGLAISKGLVELLGGGISVRSRPGEGSVFTFTLPLQRVGREISAPTEAPAGDPEAAASTARILLTEDEPMIREMITMMLVQKGHQVEIAATGQVALHKWRGGAFDLILMDLQMPEMNGLEATRMIRAAERGTNNRTRIIGLTAHARREAQDECLEAGMDAVLTKPLQMRELCNAIKSCLGA